jgi:primary-amine oxidase
MINLTQEKVIYSRQLDKFLHGPADLDEVAIIEELVHADPTLQAELKKLNITDKSLVICEPWIYGP